MHKDIAILFIDVDGVLNFHEKTPSGYCGIDPRCRDRLNRITDETGAVLVISSAWRYLVTSGEMTVKGFEGMLRTHGIKADVIGVTRRDSEVLGPDGKLMPMPDERGGQISDWLAVYGVVHDSIRYVVIDDMDLGIKFNGHPFVQTDGNVGLTEADADRAIAILKGEDADV